MGRTSLFAIALSIELAFSATAAAQVYGGNVTRRLYDAETPRPTITAQSLGLNMRSPVEFGGDAYYPTGPTVFFNGRVMAVAGAYQGVPLYSDLTLEPFSVVYVPVSGGYMRPYERKRSGGLAGTVGSRVPSFPIERDVELSVRSVTTGLITPAAPGLDLWYLHDCRGLLFPTPVPQRCLPPEAELHGADYTPFAAAEEPEPAAISLEPAAPAAPAEPASPAPVAPARGGRAAGTPQRQATAASRLDVWVDFDGQRWYSAGRAMRFDNGRFQQVGEMRGLPVYRDRAVDTGRVYVTIMPDGLVAPFARR